MREGVEKERRSGCFYGRITLRARQLQSRNGAKPAAAALYRNTTISDHPRTGRVRLQALRRGLAGSRAPHPWPMYSPATPSRGRRTTVYETVAYGRRRLRELRASAEPPLAL
jgi:hypothetical protein